MPNSYENCVLFMAITVLLQNTQTFDVIWFKFGVLFSEWQKGGILVSRIPDWYPEENLDIFK